MTQSGSIAERIASHGEWITGFTLDGFKYGGNYVPEQDFRVREFVAYLKARNPSVSSILECGCLEGGHTKVLAREFPDATIHALDVRAENLAKTQLIAELFNCPNVACLQDDLDAPQACFQRTYDAIFCVGLLYHLKWPQEFLARACRAAPVLWLWTVYCAEEEAARAEGAARGRDLHEETQHITAAVRPKSFLPTLGSLTEYLWAAGYTNVNLMKKEMTANGNGPAIFLCASR